MSSIEPQFITPPSEEEIVYPYRRVWVSIGIETGALLAVVIVVIVVSQFVAFSAEVRQIAGVLLGLMPLILWVIFSWARENFVPERRKSLFPVLVMSILAANAVGYPLVYRILDVDGWVTQRDTFERLVVYALAYGVIPEVIKYCVLWYTVWRSAFRYRYDVIAYSAAVSVGYATVLNLHYVFEMLPPPDVAVIRIFGVTVLQLLGSLVVAYGLAEIRFDKPTPLLVSGMVSLASLVIGIIYTLRSNIAGTSLSFGTSSPQLLLNLIITLVLFIAIVLAVAFLFDTSERQELQVKSDVSS